MDVTIRFSHTAARRRHAAENPGGSATFAEQEKRNALVKTIAAGAAAADPQFGIDHGTSSRWAISSMLRVEQLFRSSSRRCLSTLPSVSTAALVLP
jgi:hypothetical protein